MDAVARVCAVAAMSAVLVASACSKPRMAGAPPVEPEAGPAPVEVPAPVVPGGSVVLGDERLDEYLPLVRGRRVALFSNHTGIVGDHFSGTARARFGLDSDGGALAYGPHVLDVLVEQGVRVTAVFSPEHGFRGAADAGADVSSSVDGRTGVPILSLYGGGGTGRPSEEVMGLFDVLVIDIQDVGLRYYTYYITMYHLMDAAAASGKDVVLLDRPNPNGFYVDGPLLREEFRSGVGLLPIPVVHGMTLGELARMINGERWLPSGPCRLTVIPCLNYTHQTRYALVASPSPNLKDMRAVYLYASTCFFENTLVSVGRGTDAPFEVYGSPLLRGVEGYGFAFTPVSMEGATNPPFLGVECYGRDLRPRRLDELWAEGVNLNYLVEAYRAVMAREPGARFFGAPDAQGRYWIDKLCGTDVVRTMIEAGADAASIKAGWRDDVERFKVRRRPYLLYAE